MKKDCCDRIEKVNRRCYRAQCFATSRALIKELNWSNEKQQVSFQSRLGRRPWIKPYSDHVIVELAQKGVKKILVACPSFVADCLETLEEVAIRMKRDFIAAGGQDLRLVPAVNESPRWIADFISMINDENLTWLGANDVRDIL
jgi:ferrochelatase